MAVPRAALCPAKVNLALRVTDLRDDGYHELDTVFQTIDLWDRLEIRDGDGLSLSCNDPRVPTDERNLVLQAARRVRELSSRPEAGAALRLSKSIPVQGGLGGGSSDAAGALRLCADFWGVSLSVERLQELGRGLGADVPFFLTGGTARGRGRGDLIEPLPPVGELGLVLGLPPFGIATAEVFAGVRARLTLPRNGVSLPASSAHKWPGDNDFSFATNDLEEVVFPRWPELRRFRDALLDSGARPALLSGSGSTVFGVVPDAVGGREVVAQVRDRFPAWRIFATRAVDGRAHVVPLGTEHAGR